MANETVLTLAGIGVPPYSARGLTQTLEPLDQANNLERSVNGNLIDLSTPSFRKYKSTITGNDQWSPSCDGVWPGQQVTVDCVAQLVYAEGGTPQRPAVEGSAVTEAGFTHYRPRLVMTVMGFQVSTNEWGAQVAWTMDLEES
jgi:hypothetical protein